MHGTYAWLPDGPLGDRTSKEVMRQLFELARSESPRDTEDLLEIAATRGLRFPRIAMDAAMKERDVTRHAQEALSEAAREVEEARRRKDVWRLQLFLAFIAVLSFVAAGLQVVAAFR